MEKLEPEELASVAVEGAYEKLTSMVEGFGSSVPSIAIALLVFAFFWLLAVIAARAIRFYGAHRDRDNLGSMLGGLVKAAVLLVGALVAATVIFPSVEPVDVLGALGVSSVAIGFAFKDILQNWLAGLLILVRRPFKVGDWIEVNGVLGEVEHIETRVTMIKTFDNKLVLIPNSDLYTDMVTVWTHYPTRRSQYDVGIGYADDIDKAREVILDAVKGVDGVLDDPEPQVMEWGLDASWVTLRVRWWTDARGTMGPRREVIRAIKLALDDAGIDVPYDTRVLLFHDQTEATDGDRAQQREGWPAGDDPPEARWRADRKRKGNAAASVAAE